jgi:hypothetical protein
MELQEIGHDLPADGLGSTTRGGDRKLSMVRAKDRLQRIKLATVAASVLTFGGLTAGIAVQGVTGQAVASTGTAGANTTGTAASTGGSSTAATTSTTAAPATTTTTAPIVSAQS